MKNETKERNTTHMTCCTCGEYAGEFRQWHNRDVGYGICRPCAVEQSLPGPEHAKDLADRCGVEGVNWANESQWRDITNR